LTEKEIPMNTTSNPIQKGKMTVMQKSRHYRKKKQNEDWLLEKGIFSIKAATWVEKERRTGTDRREFTYTFYIPERRSDKDRRSSE
jgi:hypothetical protein